MASRPASRRRRVARVLAWIGAILLALGVGASVYVQGDTRDAHTTLLQPLQHASCQVQARGGRSG